MKAVFTLIALALVSTSAHAVYRPGWERPIETAEMKVLKASANFSDVREAKLTVTRQDGARELTGMVLEMSVGDQTFTRKLQITEVERDACGSTHYTAVPAEFHNGNTIFTVVLSDNLGRRCRDFHPYRWEATVSRESLNGLIQPSTLKLGGRPELVYSIASE